MTGLIFDIKRFAVHDGPGIRVTVFFKGCPLKCAWCHNPESIGRLPQQVKKTVKLDGREYIRNEIIGYEIQEEQLLDEIQKELVFMNQSGGGVTFSGGEPLLQPDFLLVMLKACQKKGIHTAVDTSLFTSWEVIERVAGFTDLFLVDLKLIDNELHRQYTGVLNTLILENLRKLSASGSKIRIRIPFIPGVNTSSVNIQNSIDFLMNLPNPVEGVDLLPFHNTASEKYKRVGLENKFAHIQSMKKEDLKESEELFTNAGFSIKIGG